MPHLSPSTDSNQSQSPTPSFPHSVSSSDVSKEIEKLNQQIRMMQIQQEILQQQLQARDRTSFQRYNRFPEFQANGFNRYSPAVNLAFGVLKWLFLFIVGFVIACVVSYTMGAQDVVNMLLQLMQLCFVPLTIFTLCVITIVTILESLQ